MYNQDSKSLQAKLVDITGLLIPEVLSALYNATAPIGFGFADSLNGPKIMSVAEASNIIASRKINSFQRLYGRMLMVELDRDKKYFDASEFDEVHGDNCASEIINELRSSQDSNSAWISEHHKKEFFVNYPDALRMATRLIHDQSDTRLLVGNETIKICYLYGIINEAIQEHLNFLLSKK